MSAVMQQITYGEFLPRILGKSAMTAYDLDLAPEGYVNTYDSQVMSPFVCRRSQEKFSTMKRSS